MLSALALLDAQTREREQSLALTTSSYSNVIMNQRNFAMATPMTGKYNNAENRSVSQSSSIFSSFDAENNNTNPNSSSTSSLKTVAALIRDYRINRAIKPMQPVQINLDEQKLKDLFDDAYRTRLVEYRQKMQKKLAGITDDENHQQKQQTQSQIHEATAVEKADEVSSDSLEPIDITDQESQRNDNNNNNNVTTEPTVASLVPLNIFGKVMALPTEVLNSVHPSRSNSAVHIVKSSSVITASSRRSTSSRRSSVIRQQQQQQTHSRENSANMDHEFEQDSEAVVVRNVPDFIDSVWRSNNQNQNPQQTKYNSESRNSSRRSSLVAVHVPVCNEDNEQCVRHQEKEEVEDDHQLQQPNFEEDEEEPQIRPPVSDDVKEDEIDDEEIFISEDDDQTQMLLEENQTSHELLVNHQQEPTKARSTSSGFLWDHHHHQNTSNQSSVTPYQQQQQQQMNQFCYNNNNNHNDSTRASSVSWMQSRGISPMPLTIMCGDRDFMLKEGKISEKRRSISYSQVPVEL